MHVVYLSWGPAKPPHFPLLSLSNPEAKWWQHDKLTCATSGHSIGQAAFHLVYSCQCRDGDAAREEGDAKADEAKEAGAQATQVHSCYQPVINVAFCQTRIRPCCIAAHRDHLELCLT